MSNKLQKGKEGRGLDEMKHGQCLLITNKAGMLCIM